MTTNVTANATTGAATEPHPVVTRSELEEARTTTISAGGNKETKGKSGARKVSTRRAMVLTARDADVVRWVYDAGVTTREHIQRLFFTSGGRTRCQQRLSLLFQHRFLDRLEGRPASMPDVYLVSRRAFRGVRLLRASGVDEPLDLQLVAPQRLQHTLDLVSCRVQFLLAARAPGIALVQWREEGELASSMGPAGIVPDAYVQLARTATHGEKRSSFFLEVERSDKSEQVLREKFQRYGAFYYGGEYERIFGTKALRVLFLIGSSYGIRPEHRCAKLSALAEEARVTFLRFTPLDAFVALPAPEVLVAPIWRKPGEPEPTPLLLREG